MVSNTLRVGLLGSLTVTDAESDSTDAAGPQAVGGSPPDADTPS